MSVFYQRLVIFSDYLLRESQAFISIIWALQHLYVNQARRLWFKLIFFIFFCPSQHLVVIGFQKQLRQIIDVIIMSVDLSVWVAIDRLWLKLQVMKAVGLQSGY